MQERATQLGAQVEEWRRREGTAGRGRGRWADAEGTHLDVIVVSEVGERGSGLLPCNLVAAAVHQRHQGHDSTRFIDGHFVVVVKRKPSQQTSSPLLAPSGPIAQ